MKKLYYEDENGTIVLGQILTNHSMSTEEALEILEINLEAWGKEQGWDGVDYECVVFR